MLLRWESWVLCGWVSWFFIEVKEEVMVSKPQTRGCRYRITQYPLSKLDAGRVVYVNSAREEVK